MRFSSALRHFFASEKSRNICSSWEKDLLECTATTRIEGPGYWEKSAMHASGDKENKRSPSVTGTHMSDSYLMSLALARRIDEIDSCTRMIMTKFYSLYANWICERE